MEVKQSDKFKKCIIEVKKKDSSLAKDIADMLENISSAKKLSDIKNCKKLKGSRGKRGNKRVKKYRIRLGDYRIGFIYTNNTIELLVFAGRKDIYKKYF